MNDNRKEFVVDACMVIDCDPAKCQQITSNLMDAIIEVVEKHDSYVGGGLNLIEYKEEKMPDIFRKEYKPLNESQKIRIEQIKNDAQKLWDSFDWAIEPDARMMAIAKTNLEQAVMWAIKAIT